MVSPVGKKEKRGVLELKMFGAVSFAMLLSLSAFSQDTLKVVNWNPLNYSNTDASRDQYYRTVIRHARPDVLVLEEMTSAAAIDSFYRRVVNVVFPGQFSKGAFTFLGGDTYNAIYYRPAKFTFIANRPIKTTLRDISEFQLYNSVAADTLRIYAVHLKASSGSANEAQRAAEVDSLRKVTNALPAGKYFIVTGDFNIYSARESCYVRLLRNNPANDGHFIDTITMPGTWNNASYAQYHTQSPRVRSFGGGATGGMDDRFDLMLFSRAIAQGNGKISYLGSSMTAIGNDGAHYNDSINRLPNASVPDSVANGIHYASDHLPISARFVFKPVTTTYPITATAGANGFINPGGVVLVDSGASKIFTISADAGYHIDSVTVDGSYAGVPAVYEFTNVISSHTINAKFVINQYTITSSAGAHGFISPSGTVAVNYGETRSYIVTPATGYALDSLIVDGFKVDSTTGYTFVNISAPHTIRAVFKADQYLIAATAGTGGTILPSGSVVVSHGANQNFIMSPDIHYSVDSVVVDGTRVDSSTSYTFNSITSSHSIRAVFTLDRYTITATADSHGMIAPSGAVSAAYGTNQTFTITPATGYHVDSVLVDGVRTDSTVTFTFNSVGATHTIRAFFGINMYTIAATAGSNGSISPSGLISVWYGSTQVFTITPDSGYGLDSLVVDGLSVAAAPSFSFTDIAADHSIAATFSPGLVMRVIPVRAGWNLVSLPLTVGDRTRTALFPTALSSAYAFGSSTGYVLRDTLRHGEGYWLKFGTPENVNITGMPIASDTIALHAGWNLIGSISYPASVDSITQLPPGIVVSDYYGYNGLYAPVATLQPGSAVWVKASTAGFLILR